MCVGPGCAAKWFAEEQSVQGPRATPAVACPIHAFLETEDTVSAAGRLGISFIPTRGQPAARRQHACRRSSEASCSEGGILSSHRDIRGHLIDDDARRFGFHNLRHSLASFLICIRTDPKTVQTLLRHSDVRLTLQFYSHAVSQDRMAAAGEMLAAILSHPADKNGLTAD